MMAVHTTTPASGARRVTIIRSTAELARLLPEWRAFANCRAHESRLFQDPDLVHVAASMDQGRTQLCVVVIREGGELTCVAPCYIEERTMTLRLSLFPVARWRARCLRAFGDRFVFDRAASLEERIEQIGLVFEALGAAPDLRFDLALFQNVAVPGPLWACVDSPARRGPLVPFVASRTCDRVHRLRLPADWDRYVSSMGRKTRNTLKRRDARLSAAFDHDVALTRVTEEAQVPWLLDTIADLYPRTWQGGGAHRRFQRRRDPREPRWLAETARRGWLRAYVLSGRGRPLAFVLGYQDRGVYYYEETGYDQAWAPLAPGTVLNWRLVADLFVWNKPDVVDFGFGDNQYKRVFGNEELLAGTLQLAQGSKACTIVAAQRALSAIEHGVRRLTAALHVDHRVRRLVRAYA